MIFITNHDENELEWDRIPKEWVKQQWLWVHSLLLCGMPLIYGGQEVGLSKRLRFFDKDTIVWSESPWTPFYKKMVELKSTNPAMNGEKRADMFRIKSVNPFIYAFTRENEGGKVLSIFNFSKEKTDCDTH